MILEQLVKVKLSSLNMKFYKSLGYVCHHKGDVIEVNAFDLQPTSRIRVKCKCDFCGKEFERKYILLHGRKKHTCGDQNCKLKLREETNIEKFGVPYPSQDPEIARKQGLLFEKRYGIGSANHDDYVKRRNETNLSKCGNLRGYDNNGDSQSKRIKTLYENFDNAKCRKGSRKPTSKTQARICELLDGVLNYDINNRIFIDIALDRDMISIEYNGLGHRVFRSQEDDDERDRELEKLGWKNIRLISEGRCKLADEELVAVIDQCKEKLKATNNCTICYDLDNKTFNCRSL